MVFRKINGTEEVASFLANTILTHLGSTPGERVLWLVPGGSSIAIVSEVCRRLAGHNLDKLTVSLTDERFGPTGHVDSNWQQLTQLGFNLPGATKVPVLVNKDLVTTARVYADKLETLLRAADYRLGFFGIGPDGHTAGILPASEAVKAQQFAYGYEAGQFERITMTPKAIACLDEAVIYAIGEAKQPILDTLEDELAYDDQPAQSLKQVAKLTIFNDYKGETK